MNKTIEHVENEANKKIPREEVSLRDGGGGKKLSYLESHYVIQRMNEVFGVCGWDSETVEMRQVNGTEAKPSYVAKVRLSAIVNTGDGGYMRVVKEGFGFGSDKSGLNPHEMAVKEAESDAFKRAARQFGMSLGLALYSKEQENVEEAAPKPVVKAEPVDKPQAAAPSTTNRKTLNDQINVMSRVVISKRFKTTEELKALLKSKYSVDSKEALSDTQARELLTELEGLANG